ncbi:hypothetical protein NDU88_005676 [Pleurodeles waltl]|uniref:Uncharacterized protein n=1 Tax=Pleurodeles waltl TaxID=8319 RepID=A0AAV7QIY6_PLEWA|nr:hypothetical protein NDU88_005676 [Pleurodeles waltl]
MATGGPGLRGPSAPDRGGAETRTEPACGLKELARRQKRQHEIRETGESSRRRQGETSEASRTGHGGLRWRTCPRPANAHGAWPSERRIQPTAQQRTLDAPEKRCLDSGDRRDGQSLRRAAWPHEDPDSVAPVPRKEEELKRGQNPRAG